VSGQTRRLRSVHDVQVDLDGNKAVVSFPRFQVGATVAHREYSHPTATVVLNRGPKSGYGAVWVEWFQPGPNPDGSERPDGWFETPCLQLVHSW